MLSRINAGYAMNFQSISKLSNVAKKGATAGAAVVAGSVLAQKPVSELSVSEMYKEFNDMPDTFNYSTDAEKQRAAELMNRMNKEGYTKNGKLIDLSDVRRKEYNNIPDTLSYATDAEKQSAAELLGRMTVEGFVKNGRFIGQ